MIITVVLGIFRFWDSEERGVGRFYSLGFRYGLEEF